MNTTDSPARRDTFESLMDSLQGVLGQDYKSPSAELREIMEAARAAKGLPVLPEPELPRLIDEREAAAWLGMTPKALSGRRRKGTGPRVYQTSPVRYAALDIDEWGRKTGRW